MQGDDKNGGGEDSANESGCRGAGNFTPFKWQLFKRGGSNGDGSSGGKGTLGNASPGILSALRLNKGSNPGADDRQNARATADIVPPSRLHSDGGGGGNLLMSSPLESGSGSGVGGRLSTTGKRVLPDVNSLNEEVALSSGGSQPRGGVWTTSVNPQSNPNPTNLRADIKALSSPGGTPTGSLVPARLDNERAQEGRAGAQAEVVMGGIPEMYMALCDRILESQRSLAGKLQKSPPKDVSTESMSSRSKEIEDIEARALMKRVGSKPEGGAGEIGGEVGGVGEGQKLKNVLFNALRDGQRGRSASDQQRQSQRQESEVTE